MSLNILITHYTKNAYIRLDALRFAPEHVANAHETLATLKAPYPCGPKISSNYAY